MKPKSVFFAPLLFLSAFASLPSAAASATPAPSRKNILFLIADDLNNLLGCYGNSLAKK